MAEVASPFIPSAEIPEDSHDDLHSGILSLFAHPNSSFSKHESRARSPKSHSMMVDSYTTFNTNLSHADHHEQPSANANHTTPPPHTPELDKEDSLVNDLNHLSSRPCTPARSNSPLPDNAWLWESPDGDDDKQLPQYSLRPSARAGGQAPTTWTDRDNSGNYDPTEERKQQSLKRKRLQTGSLKLSRTLRDRDEPAEKKFRSFKSKDTALLNGGQKPFSIKLTTVALKNAAHSIKNNWPEGHYNNITDEGGESEAGASSHLGRRRQQFVFEKRDYIPLTDPRGDEESLLGHPDARGCRNCRAAGTRCPLLDDGNEWPCHYCVDDEEDCELITPPRRLPVLPESERTLLLSQRRNRKTASQM